MEEVMSNGFEATVAIIISFSLLFGCQEQYPDPYLERASEVAPNLIGNCQANQKSTRTIDEAGSFQLQSTGVGNEHGASYQVTSALHGCLFSFTHDLDPNLQPPFADSPPNIFQIAELTSPPEVITFKGRSYQRFVRSDELARRIIKEKRTLCFEDIEATQQECDTRIRSWIKEYTAILKFAHSGRSVSIDLVDSNAYFMEVRLK
ncbi:hypothetical protein KUV57_24355 [Epibacterium sp. DP7N7-1]|nr:hypothetical protein [Epibacterium sp. DP7N7-1]